MTTDLLYLTDAYRKEFEATVVARKADAVALDRTAFYPGGGGQPADTGHLGDARVSNVFKDEEGVVWHVVDHSPPDTVRGTIDWERRHLLMRTHMALHLVNVVAWRDHQARVTGAHMEPGTGRVDLQLETMSKEFGQEVETRVNDYVTQDLPITTVYVARSEAGDDVFRGKASSIPQSQDPIRTVHIGDLDRQACSGTHVASTKEIGPIRVTKTKSKGRANKRVEIELSYGAR
jgi:misacylated tRNA(Ala) deacylase